MSSGFRPVFFAIRAIIFGPITAHHEMRKRNLAILRVRFYASPSDVLPAIRPFRDPQERVLPSPNPSCSCGLKDEALCFLRKAFAVFDAISNYSQRQAFYITDRLFTSLTVNEHTVQLSTSAIHRPSSSCSSSIAKFIIPVTTATFTEI